MKVWGLAATLGFAVLALALGEALGVATLMALKTVDPQRVNNDGTALAVATFIANPVQVITLVLAARMTGADMFDYFGLRVPRWRETALAVAALAAVIALGDTMTVAALGRDLIPTSELELYRSAQQDGTLFLLLLAVIVVGPAGEELLFRGFLFRGLIQEPRDGLPGILAIALIWAALHQHDWFDTSLLFALGVIFGYARLYSGSTLLAVLLHMIANFVSLAEAAIVLGWI
jgi:membrane protease YdiL (CAAX protease family)